MNTYFAIKRADGRYIKIRQNGKTRNWVKNLKGASVGTEAKMQACLEGIQREYRRLGRETDADGCKIVKVGEAASAWQAKLEAVNTKQIGTMAHKTTEENKFEFLIRLAGHTESTMARTIEDDMDEEQIRRECLDILGTWQGDSPLGVDVYKNGEYLLGEDVED